MFFADSTPYTYNSEIAHKFGMRGFVYYCYYNNVFVSKDVIYCWNEYDFITVIRHCNKNKLGWRLESPLV